MIESADRAENDISTAGFDLKAIFSGDTISDFGKTQAGKDLLTKPSEDSDLLIRALQGNAGLKSGRLISKILAELFGDEHKAFVNPNLSPDEVRAQFNKDPRWLSFFHELPGYIFLIKDFEADEITHNDFKKITLVNLAHNGPNKGYWERFCGMLNGVLEEKQITIHLGTPFCDENGLLTYPMPKSPEGYVHAAVDRMDQAIDGIPKLAKEVASSQDIQDVHGNLLDTCQTWTLEQMQALKNYLPELMKNFSGGEIEKLQKISFMDRLVNRVADQISKFRDYIKARVTWTDTNEKKAIEFKHDDGMVERVEKSGDKYSHTIALHQPQNRSDFMNNSAPKFLSRIVEGFNQGERYAQSV